MKSPAFEHGTLDSLIETGSWRSIPIVDLCLEHTDCVNRTAPVVDEVTPFKMVRTSNVRNGQIDVDNVKYVTEETYRRWTRRLIPQRGDVILTREAPMGGVGMVRSDDTIFLGQRLYHFRPNPDKLDSTFLLYSLMAPYLQFQMKGFAAGSTVQHMRLDDVAKLEIKVPSISEQRHIANILDRTEDLRVNRRAALAQLDTLTEAIFLEMFGDPVANDKGWRRVQFSELLDNIDSGWSPNCLDRPVIGEEWGVLKLGAATWCEYDPSHNKALPPGVAPKESLEVQPGDLLFARKNTYELVAACALVDKTPPRLLLPDLLFRFRFKKDAPIEPNYLHRLLTYPTKRKDIQKLAGGSAGSMPNISKGRLRDVMIEIPPIELQRDFMKQAAWVNKVKVAQRRSMTELDALFASLQHRAFRGEL